MSRPAALRALMAPAATLALWGLCMVLPACNHGRTCFRPTIDLTTEPYGATDVNAQTGNQGLTAGINGRGTLTVLKWPNPSYYDQVKYMTTRRTAPDLGALPNEGVFAGVYYSTGSSSGFFWLKERAVSQRYLGPRSVVVETTFRDGGSGLEVTQTDLIEPDADVLWRNYHVTRPDGSKVIRAELIVYANFQPTVSKIESLPLSDWCFDSAHYSTLRWEEGKDLFIQFREGRDRSADRPSSVFLAFGLDRNSSGHHAGQDRACSMRLTPRDPFDLAARGELPGSDRARGKVSAGISYSLDLGAGLDRVSLMVAAGRDEDSAVGLIDSARAGGFSKAMERTEDFWKKKLAKVPLPHTDNQRIKDMALRSVISMVLGFCKDSGALVASAATQPPYGEDWPRDGAYMNEALMAAGFDDLVKEHNLFYVRVQSRPGNPIRRVPHGNWASNYYADGVPGFPYIWWEIDETAYGIWTLYRYYQHTGDREYLDRVYPAIELAADFLTSFRDPKTGLPRPAHETDVPQKNQSLRGALVAYMGLKYALMAAEAGSYDSDVDGWARRKDELERVIMERFYDEECDRFVLFEEFMGDCGPPGAGFEDSTLLWPVGLLPLDDPRAQRTAENAWKNVEPSFIGGRDRGSYEVYGLLSVAKAWKGMPEKMERVKRGLEWESTVPATDTGHLGEIWVTIDGEVHAGEAQPQLWHHALFYLACLEAF